MEFCCKDYHPIEELLDSMEPFLFHRRIGEAIAILPIRAVGQVETNPADHFLRAHEHVVAVWVPAYADWIFVLTHNRVFPFDGCA